MVFIGVPLRLKVSLFYSAEDLVGKLMKNLASVFLTVVPCWGLAYAEPLSLLGLTASMPFERAEAHLEDRGYRCNYKNSIDSLRIGLGPDYCDRGNASIEFGPMFGTHGSRIETVFNCSNFNTCKYSDSAVMDLLKQNLKFVKIIKKEQIFIGEPRYFYCGYGIDGDSVCVKDGSVMLREPKQPGESGEINFN